MKEAIIYQKQAGRNVRCLICQRKCLVAEGKTGFCLTKINNGGRLFTLNYGLIEGIQVDPVEKKPFYHFYPGLMVPSLGSYGCNFHCRQCQNWHCSWGENATAILTAARFSRTNSKNILTPEKAVEEVIKNGYRALAFTYNEPTVWPEFVSEAAKMAKKAGLFTLYVTNGSWTKELLDKIGKYIDAANIDFKGFSPETYVRQGGFFGNIPEMAEYAQKKYQIFLEITTLLIPGINDDHDELKRMTEWIASHLGDKTPWHLSRFSPDLAPDPEFAKIPPTGIDELEKAAIIGQKAGLKFIYIWAPGSDLPGGVYSRGDTFCPKCRRLVVRRAGWRPVTVELKAGGLCLACGENLNFKI